MQPSLAIDSPAPTPDAAESLLALGLISARDVVDDAVVLRPADGRRSRTLRIERAQGESLFVKRADPDAPSHALAREASVCRLIARSGRPIAQHVPRIVAESTDGRLVTELLQSATCLAEHHGDSASASAALGSATGRLLAMVHELPGAGIGPEPGPALPPVFDLGRPSVDLYCSLSGANLVLLELAQEAGTTDLLAALGEDWRDGPLIHGDVRLSNLLVDDPDSPSPHVWLVDWEYGSEGDPCWDVGCLLAHHLSVWLSSMPHAPADAAAALSGRARRPLEGLQPGMTAAWRAYRDARSSPPADAVRAVRFAGAALIEIGLSLGQQASVPTHSQLRHLQVAHNVLLRPVEAGVHLIGLQPSELIEEDAA